MSDDLRVAVVTTVHNRRELTLQCLRSLSRINSDGLDVSVIVVDDGSTDGTSDAIAHEFPNVKVVPGSGDLWFTEGTNVGVREALRENPEYVLMMNDDQVFDAEFLRSIVETAESNPRSVVGPLLLLWDQPHKIFQIAPVWNTWLGGWQHWFQQTVWTVPERPFEVDLIVGNCVLVPAAAIQECGLMNSKHYPNFGDAEYTPRLKRAGWKLLIDPRARVFCQPNTVPTSVRKKSFGQMFKDLFVDLKNVNSLRRRWYAYMDTAPSKLSGATAFCIFIARAFIGVNPESPAFAERNPEIPLRERFSNSAVKEHSKL